MKIVLVGEANAGSRTPQRLRALRDLGHDVTMVATTPEGWTYETRPSLLARVLYRLRLPMDNAGANSALIEAASRGCDVVILDNARTIRPATLREVRRAVPRAKLVWYSEDDSMNPRHRTRWLEAAIPLFDLWVTTKSFNAMPGEVPALGARRVLFTDNCFCPHTHAPIELTEAEGRAWGAPISFVGTFERPRAESLLALSAAGLRVRVWGNGWGVLKGETLLLEVEDRPVYGDDYRRVVAASAINLCFLRKGNRDRQTCRSMEIPAMGGFMLHESSDELANSFRPDLEAAYFASDAELVTASRRWLADDDGRRAVAAAGRMRAHSGNFSHSGRWRVILDAVMGEPCAY